MDPTFVALPDYQEYSLDVMKRRAAEFHEAMRRRRTVREFSDRPVAREVIEQCLCAAGTTPNGANMQPWHFVVVSDPATKQQIRRAAEAEEYEFYHRKAPREWLDALASLGTDDSPMGFLNEMLDRPPHERPFLILVVGYPADGATVPVISKKRLDEIASFV